MMVETGLSYKKLNALSLLVLFKIFDFQEDKVEPKRLGQYRVIIVTKSN
jgi:hypothetical protein